MSRRNIRPGSRPLACAATPGSPGSSTSLGIDGVGQVLGEQRRRELRLARSFRECWGLSPEEIEDIYQDTALALMKRPHNDAEHVLKALRLGIKQRAQKLHRDLRRRREILTEHAPGIDRVARARESEREPEREAERGEERDAAMQFLGELSALERAVFVACTVHGLGYAAVAEIYGIGVADARRAGRAARGKREGHHAPSRPRSA